MARPAPPPHPGQGTLLLPRFRHHLRRPDGHRTARRRRCDPRCPEGLGHIAAADVPPGTGPQLELCGLPRRHGTRLRAGCGAGHRRRLGLPVRDGLPARGLLRPDGRTRHADGGHPGALRRPVRNAPRTGAHPLGGLQRDGRGADAVAHAAHRREGHGLDVRQLFDHGTTRGSRLVEAVPRRHEAPLRRALCKCGRRQGGTDRHRGQQPSRLPRTARGGAARTARKRDEAGAVVRKLRPENN